MKKFILCLSRDMQSEFTFMQRVLDDGSTASEAIKLKGWFELSFGKSSVVACEVLNYRDDMDIDDMIIQHPFVPAWTLSYFGSYMFKKKPQIVEAMTKEQLLAIN